MRDQSYLLKIVNLFNKEISILPFNFHICVYHILKVGEMYLLRKNNHF